MIHLFSEKFPLKYNIPGIYYIQINSHSYNKYKDGGKIYYQILEICSQDELKNREKYWIDKLRPDINVV